LHYLFFFFFTATATTEIYTLSLHDALPISQSNQHERQDKGSPEKRVSQVPRHTFLLFLSLPRIAFCSPTKRFGCLQAEHGPNLRGSASACNRANNHCRSRKRGIVNFGKHCGPHPATSR